VTRYSSDIPNFLVDDFAHLMAVMVAQQIVGYL
jgi:hypothetical protein